MLWQPSLPDIYTRMPSDDLAAAISQRRKELGSDLVILGHHYQTDEVIQHADYTGDSLKLSQIAAKLSQGSGKAPRYIMFCGVHFMAESADMLTPPEVAVILPDLSAGCSMADMAQYDDTVQAWNDIHASLAEQGWSGRIIPITYVNSSAAIKAFVGAHGGACCTSSNALEVFKWAMGGSLGGPPLRGGSPAERSLLQPVPTKLDTLDHIRLHPRGFIPRDPYPKGQASPKDLKHVERDLPHLQPEDATYFVAWKTHEDRALTPEEMSLALSALAHFDGDRCRVYAASVMTTHVHWIVRPFAGHSILDLCNSVKRFSAKSINERRASSGHVWQGESFDHIIRDEGSFIDKMLYTIRNPVMAGVAQSASEYRWSLVHADVGWEKATPAPEGRATGTKVLFLPDQHLGRNTAAKFGIDVGSRSCVYDPRTTRKGVALGGAMPKQLLDSDVILWAGHCSVHKLFRPEHCDQIRQLDKVEGLPPRRGGLQVGSTTIIVHPECCKEVVDKADLNGSTEFIIKTIQNAPAGSRWAVGTEIHLVNRIAKEAALRGVHVRILSDCQCLCTTMYRIDQPHMLWVLDNLAGKFEERIGNGKTPKARIVNQIIVPNEVREPALLAIDRMLSLSASPAPTIAARIEQLATAD